jgi:CrcB protein
MLLGTGFLGGFTTFSHLVDGVRELTVGGSPGWAAVYLVLSVVLGLLAVWAGIRLGGERR